MAITNRYPILYYPIQIVLAICGIVLGLFLYGVWEHIAGETFGKPHVFMFILIVIIPPIILVRIHRKIVTDRTEDATLGDSEK